MVQVLGICLQDKNVLNHLYIINKYHFHTTRDYKIIESYWHSWILSFGQ